MSIKETRGFIEVRVKGNPKRKTREFTPLRTSKIRSETQEKSV